MCYLAIHGNFCHGGHLASLRHVAPSFGRRHTQGRYLDYSRDGKSSESSVTRLHRSSNTSIAKFGVCQTYQFAATFLNRQTTQCTAKNSNLFPSEKCRFDWRNIPFRTSLISSMTFSGACGRVLHLRSVNSLMYCWE